MKANLKNANGIILSTKFKMVWRIQKVVCVMMILIGLLLSTSSFSQCTIPDTPTVEIDGCTTVPGNIFCALCEGQDVHMRIVRGNLNDATDWVWYNTSNCQAPPPSTEIGRGLSITVTAAPDMYITVKGVGPTCSGGCFGFPLTNFLLKIVTQPASQNICVGNSLSLRVAASGSGLSYQWKKDGVNIAGATDATYLVTPAAAEHAGVYSVDVTTSTNCSTTTVTSDNAVVTINTSATITTQPPPTQTLCEGNTLNLSVTATGTGLTYQWKKNSTNITGATSNTLSIPALTATDAGTYSVEVTGTGTCTGTVVSNNAIVAINAPATITTQPTPTQTLCVGNTLNLSVTATGTGLAYQWKKNNTNITGATNSTLSISALTATDAGTYSVDVTSSGTCTGTVVSNNAIVAINAPATITTQPTPTQTLCVGNTLNLSVTATGTGLAYQWKKNNTNITGATNSTLSIAALTTTDAGAYSVEVTSTGTCTGTVVSNNAVVAINAPATITTQPTPTQTLCTGNTLNLSVTATGTALTYQWKKNNTNITGATNSTLSISTLTATDAGTYSVEVTGTGTCSGTVVSTNAVVTINAPATITTQPTATQTLCEGNTLNLSVTATGTGLTYQWKKNNTNITGATNSTLSISTLTATDAGTYSVEVTSTGTCSGTVVSTNAVVTINAPATITTQPTATQTLCEGNTLNLSVTATGTGLTYQWKKNNTNITGATNSTLSISTLTATDAGTYSVDVTSSGTCTGTVVSNNAVVAINAPVTITTQPTDTQTLCTGNTLTLSVTATGTGLVYQWKKNNTNITGATNSTLSIAALTATDAGTYSVEVTNTGTCTGSVVSNNAVVAINAPITITTQPTPTQTLCEGNTLNLSVTATGTGLTYQWKKNNTNITGATNSTLSISALTATDAGTYSVDVTSTGTCTGSVVSNNAVVAINAPITITTQPTATQTLCEGNTLTLSVTATGTGLTYQWKKNNTNITGATSRSFSIPGIVTADAGAYTVEVTSSGVCVPATIVSNNGNVMVSTPAGITLQPADQTVCAGSTTNFTVTATGTNLLYQWQEDSGRGFANINTGSYSGMTSSTLTITNVDNTMNGNKYKVIITNGGCSTTSDGLSTLKITTLKSIITQPKDTTICIGNSARFNVTANNNNLTYQWLTDAGNSFVNVSDNDVYSGANTNTLTINHADKQMDGVRFNVRIRGNCIDETSAAVTLKVNSLPIVSAGPDKTIELGSAATLEGSVTGADIVQYQWLEITSTSALQPAVSPTLNTTYTFRATNSKGCTASDQALVVVLKQLRIPNAFSPNNDGINDTWNIENLDQFPQPSIQVYNRYGDLVFSSASNAVSWNGTYNGKKLTTGMYYYVIDLKNGKKPLTNWIMIFN